jgi:hypothetical protein
MLPEQAQVVLRRKRKPVAGAAKNEVVHFQQLSNKATIQTWFFIKNDR